MMILGNHLYGNLGITPSLTTMISSTTLGALFAHNHASHSKNGSNIISSIGFIMLDSLILAPKIVNI